MEGQKVYRDISLHFLELHCEVGAKMSSFAITHSASAYANECSNGNDTFSNELLYNNQDFSQESKVKKDSSAAMVVTRRTTDSSIPPLCGGKLANINNNNVPQNVIKSANRAKNELNGLNIYPERQRKKNHKTIDKGRHPPQGKIGQTLSHTGSINLSSATGMSRKPNPQTGSSHAVDVSGPVPTRTTLNHTFGNHVTSVSPPISTGPEPDHTGSSNVGGGSRSVPTGNSTDHIGGSHMSGLRQPVASVTDGLQMVKEGSVVIKEENNHTQLFQQDMQSNQQFVLLQQQHQILQQQLQQQMQFYQNQGHLEKQQIRKSPQEQGQQVQNNSENTLEVSRQTGKIEYEGTDEDDVEDENLEREENAANGTFNPYQDGSMLVRGYQVQQGSIQQLADQANLADLFDDSLITQDQVERSVPLQYELFQQERGIYDSVSRISSEVRSVVRSIGWKCIKLLNEDDMHHNSPFATMVLKELRLFPKNPQELWKIKDNWGRIKKDVADGMSGARSAATQKIQKGFNGEKSDSMTVYWINIELSNILFLEELYNANRLPALNELEKGRQNTEAYNLFAQYLVTGCIKTTTWKDNCNINPFSTIVNESDEAVTFLILANNWDAWIEQCQKTKNGKQPKVRELETKQKFMLQDGRGYSYSVEGRQYYNAMFDRVEKDREAFGQQFDIQFLNLLNHAADADGKENTNKKKNVKERNREVVCRHSGPNKIRKVLDHSQLNNVQPMATYSNCHLAQQGSMDCY